MHLRVLCEVVYEEMGGGEMGLVMVAVDEAVYPTPILEKKRLINIPSNI